jgi:hypothetical protein
LTREINPIFTPASEQVATSTEQQLLSTSTGCSTIP